MTIVPPDRNRQVVPRWRRSTTRAVMSEMAPVGAPLHAAPKSGELDAQEQAFSASPNFWTAADLVSAATALGRTSTSLEAAVRHLRAAPRRSKAIDLLIGDTGAGFVSQNDHERVTDLVEAAKRDVRRARALLTTRPRSVLALLDLALGHLTLGNRQSGKTAIRRALALAPDNRLVLRSAARFFVHVEETGEALHWLGRSARLEFDPWLMSAHIAISQVDGSPATHVRQARALLASGVVSPLSGSELHAALSGLEFRAGRDKPARLYMQAALQEPTENSVAQGIWAVERGLRGVRVSADSAPNAFEATTLEGIHAGQWAKAIDAVHSWLVDEPYSMRAAIHGSFIAITGAEDYEQAFNFVEAGLRTSPGHPMLLNNGAFALASLGKLNEATALLDSAVSVDETLDGLLSATRGFVAFRSGDSARGREHYKEAVRVFKANNDSEKSVVCQLMWAREEIRSGGSLGDRLLEDASKEDPGSQRAAADVWAARVRNLLNRKTS